MTENRKKWKAAVWYLAVFAFLYLWFTRVSVLVPYDGDDWLYLSAPRRALPIWGYWNPAKVLPEVLMPLCGMVAAHVVMPLTGDYIGAIILVSALLVSTMITVYVYFFDRVLRRRFSLSGFVSACLSALFLVLHFLVFRSQETWNNHLFHCFDLVCYYNYLVPTLLNCCLILFLMDGGYDQLIRKKDWKGLSLFALLLYFAIFSNLPSSVILAIHCGCRVLLSFPKTWKERKWLVWLKDNGIHWLILILWLVSAVYELNGARASDGMGYRLPLLLGIKEVVYRFLLFLKKHNGMFAGLVAAVAVIASVLLVQSRCRREEDRKLLEVLVEGLICGAVMFAAVVILCVVVDITYITRGEYLFGLYFYGFLILMSAAAYILKRLPAAVVILPLLVCILVCEVNTHERTFMNPNLQGCDADICIAVNNDILRQFAEAEAAGLAELELHVPVSGRIGNWPHSDIVGQRISDTLYEHGILSHPIRTITIPDMDLNERYGVPLLG